MFGRKFVNMGNQLLIAIFACELINYLLYLPECREILGFSDGSAAAAGYGGYYGDGGGYGEISTFVCE